MISLNGKNGTANIRTSVFDNDTISQVIGILNSPISKGSKVEIMPWFSSYIHYSFYHPFYLPQTAAAFDLTSS